MTGNKELARYLVRYLVRYLTSSSTQARTCLSAGIERQPGRQSPTAWQSRCHPGDCGDVSRLVQRHRRPRRRHPDCCKMRARCFSVNWGLSSRHITSRSLLSSSNRCVLSAGLAACRRPRRCIDSGRRLSMPSLACFEVALPLIAGQVSVDDGASLLLGGSLVLTLPSLPRNAVRVISQAPHRHRCPEPTLTCN